MGCRYEAAPRRVLAAPLVVAVLALAFALAPIARANVTHAGAGEPAFTKGTSNTWFFNWSNPSSNDYYVCFQFWKDGVEQNAENTDCYHKGSALSGTQSETRTGLLSGHQYTMEAHSYYDTCGCGIYGYSDLDDAQSTTMDNSAPSASAGVDGSAVYTNNPVLALHVDYSDSISWPWPSTFDCISKGAACTSLNYDPNCSQANVFHGLNNSFDCHSDLSSVASHDGTWYFCAIESDSALPDNPSNTNQFTATSNQANLSGSSCGYVTLDTTAPVETPTADHTTVTVGQLVNFTAQSSDSSSGVDSTQYTWSFGDNTAGASGPSTGHTYTAAGAYQVTLNGKDKAGNSGVGHLTITVNPASSGGGGTTTGGGGGTTTGGGGGTTTTSGGGTTTSGGGGSTIGSTTISQLAGGGSTQSSSVGRLSVLAPRRFRSGLRSLVLALTASTPGHAQAVLVRGGRIVARRSATYRRPGTYSLRLSVSKRLKPGSYSIKVTFTPSGSQHGSTRTLKLKVVRAKAHHKLAVLPVGRVTVAGGPVLTPPALGPRG